MRANFLMTSSAIYHAQRKHRGNTEGFYPRHVPSDYQNYTQGNSGNTRQQFVGEALACDGQYITVDVKNHFRVGDTLELISPAGNHHFTMDRIRNRGGDDVDQAPGSGHVVSIPRPEEQAVASDGGHVLLMRHL